MDNSFCIINREIGEIKKDFFARIWSKPPIFEYVKKVLFWLIFYGFLISMKKLKNRLFVKKTEKYLKCEFQKTCTFEVTCWKMMQVLSTKVVVKVCICAGAGFSWYTKITQKIRNFLYQNLHSSKKSSWKVDFSQITHM